MTHGSLFNGIGGFMLAALFMGWKNIFYCEIDEWCNKIAKRNFPNSTCNEDIRKTDFNIYRGIINVLSGGDPCQPHSVAGLGKGTTDDRYLWPEMFRAIREIQPPWVVNENVVGSVSNGVLDLKIDDLESLGYSCQPYNIPSEGVGTTGNRERIWLVAFNSGFFTNNRTPGKIQRTYEEKKLYQWNEVQHISKPVDIRSFTTDTNFERFEKLDPSAFSALLSKGVSGYFGFGDSPHGNITRNEIESAVIRMLDGLPDGMDYVDRNKRIKALGNAIVWQVAYEIFKAIEETEKILQDAQTTYH